MRYLLIFLLLFSCAEKEECVKCETITYVDYGAFHQKLFYEIILCSENEIKEYIAKYSGEYSKEIDGRIATQKMITTCE